jgi:hypothetical protein
MYRTDMFMTDFPGAQAVLIGSRNQRVFMQEWSVLALLQVAADPPIWPSEPERLIPVAGKVNRMYNIICGS